MQNQECTDFIAAVPTVFDETVALAGEMGEYAVVARRKGNTWYVAAMTNWTARHLTIDCSFLGDHRATADIFADGINADREATDYQHQRIEVDGKSRLPIYMAPGGGWTAIIR